MPTSSLSSISHSALPWSLQATQPDQGETSTICDAKGGVVCRIPSAVWDSNAPLQYVEDAANTKLILGAPGMLQALRKAESALVVLAEAYEQATEITQAGGWATDALREVREALANVHTPATVPTSFRVVADVELWTEGIEAYDEEAAERYVRENLKVDHEDINGGVLDLDYDGDGKVPATISLPENPDITAMLTAGRAGDPDGTMEHGTFKVSVAARVEFEVVAPFNASPAEVILAASKLLQDSRAFEGVEFYEGGMGSLSIAKPINVQLLSSE